MGAKHAADIMQDLDSLTEQIDLVIDQRNELADALLAIVDGMWTQPGNHFHPTDEDRANGATQHCPKCIHEKARAALEKAGWQP